MLNEDTTQVDEVKDNEAEDIVQDEPKAKTVDELLNEKDNSTVPLSTFLDTKKEKKALQSEIEALKKQVEDGATKREVTSDLKDIASKYDIDADFLSELSSVIYSKARSEAEETLNSKLQPLEAKEKAAKINEAFNREFDKVLEENSEYANVVNKDVIKELSLLPSNANKTFQQILEETYGKTVTGKKTMETSTPRGGKDMSIDMSQINDPEYFKQVMASPELKKKYNEDLTSRISF